MTLRPHLVGEQYCFNSERANFVELAKGTLYAGHEAFSRRECDEVLRAPEGKYGEAKGTAS